jgi:DNA-binding NarL/FixJ family response regulator
MAETRGQSRSFLSRICCIDDNPLCIHGLKHALSAAGHEMIGSLDRHDQLEAFLENSPCDVLISELRVGDFDLLNRFHGLMGTYTNSKWIVYSYDENPTHVARAYALDAWDYVPKRFSVQRLIQTCESVRTGHRLPDSLVCVAKTFLTCHHKPSESIEVPLTKREHQILIHLSLGLSNRDISKSLSISLETVKEHVKNVLRKLKISDRTAAAIWSLRNGVPTLNFDHPQRE